MCETCNDRAAAVTLHKKNYCGKCGLKVMTTDSPHLAQLVIERSRTRRPLAITSGVQS